MKMKVLVLMTFLFSTPSFGNVTKADKIYNSKSFKGKNQAIAQELAKSKYYFSSAIFAKEFLVEGKKITPKFEKLLENLILKTGTMTFMNLKMEVFRKHDSTSLNFIAGIKLFWAKRYKQSIKFLKNFPTDHRFTPEAKFILASAYNILDRDEEAFVEYDLCIEKSEHFENQSKNKKLGRYFGILRESCHIHKARILFKQRKYEPSMKAFEEIPKTSYRWPYLLLEKAWSNYYLGDYNRSLGLLVTYKSPLLKSYFMPEAEVLNALSYFRLCLWQDSLQVIDQYYKVYKPQSVALKKLLVKEKKSHSFFLRMMMQPIKEQEGQNPYIRNLMTQIRKKIKFSLDLVNYKKIQNELKFLKKRKNTKFISVLREGITGALGWRTKHLNHYIKRQMFSFINSIHRYSYEMFNIKLEIMALKRDLVYDNKTLISSRSRGSSKNIKRRSDQHFYKFNGEFFADELGDYSFGLKSNCEKVKTKKLSDIRR